MRLLLKLGMSLGVSFAVLGLMFHLFAGGISLENHPSVLRVLKNTTYSLLFVYGLFYLVQLALRAKRYQILIAAGGEKKSQIFFI